MPSLFVVIGNEQVPRLYVSQQPLKETLRALRSYPYSHTRYSYVFETKALKKGAESDPTGHVQLLMVGRVNPSDPVETHQFSLGDALDQLPEAQAINRTQQAIDYLQRKLSHYEGGSQSSSSENATASVGVPTDSTSNTPQPGLEPTSPTST
jgi:hypothetical protein